MNRDFGSDIFEDEGSTPSNPPPPQDQETRENHPGSPSEKPPGEKPDPGSTAPEAEKSGRGDVSKSPSGSESDQTDPPRQREQNPRRKPRRRRRPQRGGGSGPTHGDRGRHSSPRQTDQKRIAVLIDIATFEEGVQQSESQVSYSRVLRHIAGPRSVVSAIAYVTPEVKPVGTQQLETREVSDAGAVPVAMTMDAMSLSSGIDAIIFIPSDRRLEPLIAALQDRHVSVESAGFCPQEATDEHGEHHELGPECIFIP